MLQIYTELILQPQALTQGFCTIATTYSYGQSISFPEHDLEHHPGSKYVTVTVTVTVTVMVTVTNSTANLVIFL